MSRDLYDAAHAWLGQLKGGLASATIVGCAGFSALSGSSLAAALTMGRVSLPEMQRYKYHDGLATGAIAAGGTLGILIPPSAGFVVYAILTEESIGQLFMAGVLPGLLLTALCCSPIWGKNEGPKRRISVQAHSNTKVPPTNTDVIPTVCISIVPAPLSPALINLTPYANASPTRVWHAYMINSARKPRFTVNL